MGIISKFKESLNRTPSIIFFTNLLSIHGIISMQLKISFNKERKKKKKKKKEDLPGYINIRSNFQPQNERHAINSTEGLPVPSFAW